MNMQLQLEHKLSDADDKIDILGGKSELNKI